MVAQDFSSSSLDQNTVGTRVQGIKELVDSGTILHHIPANYIRPPSQRPSLSHSCAPDHVQQIPVISLCGFDLDDDHRSKIVEQIGRACEEWGFFQVIDHGIPRHVVEGVWEAARRFFGLPAEERMRFYTTNFKNPVGYWTSFNLEKETVREWKDSLILRRGPDFEFNGYERAPEILRESFLEYTDGVRILAGKIWKAILESLGADHVDLQEGKLSEYIDNEVAAITYYPPCPDPSLTLGLSSHSDIGVLTILMADEVPGLQILKDQTWLTVNPLPNSFVINVADQIQILTNGKYKSVEHRVVTNSEKPRMSIPMFFQPSHGGKVGPLSKFVNMHNPALYKETIYGDFLRNVYSKSLNSKSNLDFAKVAADP